MEMEHPEDYFQEILFQDHWYEPTDEKREERRGRGGKESAKEKETSQLPRNDPSSEGDNDSSDLIKEEGTPAKVGTGISKRKKKGSSSSGSSPSSLAKKQETDVNKEFWGVCSAC